MPITTYYEWHVRYEESLPDDLRELLIKANEIIGRPRGHIAVRRHLYQEPYRKYVFFGKRFPEIWHYQVLYYTGAGIEYGIVPCVGPTEAEVMAYLAGVVDGAWELKKRSDDEP